MTQTNKELNIEGDYTFTIKKEGNIYIATGKTANDDNETFITSGRTKQELFENITDAYLTALEIPC